MRLRLRRRPRCGPGRAGGPLPARPVPPLRASARGPARVERARRRSRSGCSRSAITSAAGSATSTPTSDTLRSISVTRPKSRSMRMSESVSTPKPAIAVMPDAATAAPVRAVRAPQRLDRVAPGDPLLAVALGQQHAELGRDRDHQRAERDRHRVQRHAHGEQDQRRPARREHDRHERRERAPAIAAERDREHQRDRREARRAVSPVAATGSPPARRTAPRAPAGRPGCALHPLRRMQARAHRFDHAAAARGPSAGCRTPASPRVDRA